MTLKGLGTTIVLVATLTAAGNTAAPAPALAQTTSNQVESNVQGTIGLGLVGAELGFVLPAAFGLDEWWAFVIFPVIGAAGGAVGGYFLFDQPDRVEGGVAVLATGMALAIPAMVLTLALTAYDPSDEGYIDEEEAAATGEEGEAAPPPPAQEASRRRAARLARAGTGLVRFAEGQMLLGVPGAGVLPPMQNGRLLAQRLVPEVHVPLVTGSF